MPLVIDRLPIPNSPRNVTLANGDIVEIKPLQPIVWISISPPEIVLPGIDAPRFPAVIDTGFNNTLLIQDSHLERWADLSAGKLRLSPVEPVAIWGQRLHFRLADVWLYSHEMEKPALASNQMPHCLEMHPGIVVVAKEHRELRLPLLGMRGLAWNKTRLEVDFPSGSIGRISLSVPD